MAAAPPSNEVSTGDGGTHVRYAMSGSKGGSEEPSGGKLLWSAALQIAGATAGLAALIYLGGAMTMWLRLELAGYPGDLGVQHQPRAKLAAIGLRGVLAVVAVLVALAIAFLVATLVYRFLTRRYSRLRRIARPLTITLGATAFVVSFFLSWRSFGLVVLLLTGLVIAAYLDRLRASALRWALAVLGAFLAALFAVVAWQVDRTTNVQAVFLEPVPQRFIDRIRMDDIDNAGEVAFIYFGETENFVYLEAVRSAIPLESGGYRVNVCNEPLQIVELKRSEATLRYAADPILLYPRGLVESPGAWLRDRLVGDDDDEMRATGAHPVCSRDPGTR